MLSGCADETESVPGVWGEDRGAVWRRAGDSARDGWSSVAQQNHEVWGRLKCPSLLQNTQQTVVHSTSGHALSDQPVNNHRHTGVENTSKIINKNLHHLHYKINVWTHVAEFMLLFWKKVILLLSKDASNWSKMTLKTCIMLQKNQLKITATYCIIFYA